MTPLHRRLAITGLMVLATATLAAGPAPAASAKDQVWQAELAFARAMAERNLVAFGQLVSDEAVFFDEPQTLRGKAAVLQAWAAYFKGEQAPFAWQPDQVEVLESGTLALSTGPVRDAAGKLIARFQSIWRLESPGVWRVVFDKGSPYTPGPANR